MSSVRELLDLLNQVDDKLRESIKGTQSSLSWQRKEVLMRVRLQIQAAINALLGLD